MGNNLSTDLVTIEPFLGEIPSRPLSIVEAPTPGMFNDREIALCFLHARVSSRAVVALTAQVSKLRKISFTKVVIPPH